MAKPGSNDKLNHFVKENYGVTFPMMSKISVKGSSITQFISFFTNKERRYQVQVFLGIFKIFN